MQAAVVNVERAIDGVQKIEQEDEIKYESFVENDEIVKAHFQIDARFWLARIKFHMGRYWATVTIELPPIWKYF